MKKILLVASLLGTLLLISGCSKSEDPAENIPPPATAGGGAGAPDGSNAAAPSGPGVLPPP